jgi:diguanylate cyclase (GGDEF)-like protein/PAS domain S-box-containing protein
MPNQTPVRLLILDNSPNSSEELVEILRNSGRATRAQLVESHESLQSLLKAQSWDLFLSRWEAHDVTAEQAIGLVKEFERDIPFILIADDNNVESLTTGLRMGATDVALEDEDDRLVLIVERELNNLENRRARRKAEIELKETEKRNQLLLESSKAAIAYVHDGMHIYANKAYCELFAYEDFDELEIVPIVDLIAPEDQTEFKKFLKSFSAQEDATAEYQCIKSDGESIGAHMNLTSAQYDGEPCTQVIIRPAGDGQELEDRLHELSYQDQLTGLPNRRRFIEMLDQAVERASDGESSIVFYIVPDNFEQVVERSGLSDADLILSDIASLMNNSLNESHLLARFGDDAFTLLYPDGNKEAAEELAESIRESVESHMSEVDGKTYQLTVSIGMTLVGESATSSEQIISRTRQVLGEAETSNTVVFYQTKEAVEAEQKTAEQGELRELVTTAIDKGRLKLLFQPIISLHGDEDEQFEVLLRLIDEEEKELTPSQFMDVVHDEGLSTKLDRWIILQSIKALAAHRSNGSQTRLFINITHETIADESFLSWINVALKAAKLPIDSVILQIHESDAITYMKQASIFTQASRDQNCKTSINHFGCSLDPFNTLRHLTIDYVKLDGSYAQGIESNEQKSKELVDTIKSLRAKGVLTAIAGVESPMVMSTLWEAGVNYIQGHYLSEPLETMDYDFAGEDM